MTRFVTLTEAGDTTPGGQRMTKALIQELADRFSDIGRVPVTFGRLRSQSEPKAGNVTAVGVSKDGTALQAAVKPVEGMAGSVPEGAFSDLTPAVAKTDSGGYYLHHVEADLTPPRSIQRLTTSTGKAFGDVRRTTFEDQRDTLRFGVGGRRTEDLAKHM